MAKVFFVLEIILFSTFAVGSPSSVPEWSKGIVWYQIFPERFRNGSLKNDQGGEISSWVAKVLPELRGKAMPVSDWRSDWFEYSPEEDRLRTLFRQNLPELTQAFNESFGTNAYLFPRNLDLEIYLGRRYGGDLEGIRKEIPYLKKLGVEGVYLNPVFVSPSLHKYDTADYRHIDPYFGPTLNQAGKPTLYEEDVEILSRRDLGDDSTWGFTNADIDFMSLVNEFHKAGMRVVIDGVFNHSAASGIMMEDIAMRGPQSPYTDWIEAVISTSGNFSANERQYYPCLLADAFPNQEKFPFATKVRFRGWTGNVCTMPQVRKSNEWDGALHPDYQEFVFKIAKRWLAPQKVSGMLKGRQKSFQFEGADGIRLDVYRDIPETFWRKFRNRVKEIRPDALILAEDWGDGFDILKGDSADSLMNYTVRTISESWMIDNTGPGDERKYFPSWIKGFVDYRQKNQRSEVIPSLWSMLESHDTDRIYSKTKMSNRVLLPPPRVLGQHTLWDEADINRPHQTNSPYDNGKPSREDAEFYKALITFQMSYTGAPMIYYGAEVGMWGADDPTNRKPMLWEDLKFEDETQCTTAFEDAGARTGGSEFCQRQFSTKYSVAPDKSLFEFFQRLIAVRKSHKSLTLGDLTMDFFLEVEGQKFQMGNPAFDRKFLWGFERKFANDYAYFISNQNLSVESQNVTLYTRFAPGSLVKEVVTDSELRVGTQGEVRLRLPRDRAFLLVKPQVD